MEQEDDAMQVSAPRFDWSFNFGHVLTSLTMAAAVGGFIWWASDRIASFEFRIQAADTRASLWIPVIQAGQKANDVQDERIGNISDAMKGVRADIAENNRQTRGELSDVKKDVATIREGMAELRAKSSRN